MRTNNSRPTSQTQLPRRGMASLEVVMTIAVMLPIAGALCFWESRCVPSLYQVIGALVAWPFL